MEHRSVPEHGAFLPFPCIYSCRSRILRPMRLLLVLFPFFLATTTFASLEAYDAVIISDQVDSGLMTVTSLTSAVSFDGSAGVPFNFGVSSGAVSMEFILDGDPVGGGLNAYLAVGANSVSSLRYEQWRDTGQMGFTQSGLLDYVFNPQVLSPTGTTHVAYLWDPSGYMRLYLNGALAGEALGVTTAFAMPTGAGRLGAVFGDGQTMLGTIHRITVYDELVSEEDVLRHADAFNGVKHPPEIRSFTADPEAFLAPGSSTIRWQIAGSEGVSLNGLEVTALTNSVVSPLVTTLYELVATNEDGAVTGQVTVTVNPAPVIDSFTFDRGYVVAGESATLSWTTRFGSDWAILELPGDANGLTTNGIGQIRFVPTVSQDVTLRVTNAFGTTTASVPIIVATPASHVVISECMADNESSLADEDGAFSDWIELFNPTPFPVNLGGYHLTDDATDLVKWVIPSIELAAGQRVVLFASGKNPPRLDHAPFRLNNEGEFLALVAPDGTSIVHAYHPFPAQRNDISYGLLGGDPSLLVYMGNPTPGGENDPSPPLPYPVEFSRTSLLFAQALPLVLSSADPGAAIYYTTDGSLPDTVNGTLYTNGLVLTQSTYLRAVSVLNGPSSVVTGHQYVRLAAELESYASSLPIMVIDNLGSGIIPAKAWSGNGAGVQQVARQSAMWATFERDSVTGTSSLLSEPDMASRIGIRGRGSFSSTWRQKPYSVEAWDEQAGERKVQVLGMPAHSDWILYYPDIDANKDPTMMYNTFMYELARSIGHDAVRFRFVEAFINEDGGDLSLADRRGVYVVLEKVSRGDQRLDFEPMSADGTTGGWLLDLNRTDAIPVGGFPTVNGSTSPQYFHTPGPNGVVETAPNAPGGGDDIPRQVNGFLNMAHPSGYTINTAQRSAIEQWFVDFEALLYDDNRWLNPTNHYSQYIDTRDFVEYFIFNNLSMNGDGMLISMFPWKSSKDGKLRMGPPWDYNWSSYDGSPTETLWNRADRLWYGRLFTDPDFMQEYIDRWFELRDSAMSNDAMDTIIDGQAGEIGAVRAIAQGVPDGNDWTNRVTTFKTWLGDRAVWLDGQYTPRPVFGVPGGEVPVGFDVTIAANGGAIYYTLDGSDPRASGGGLSPNAQAYSLGVDLQESTFITARTQVGNTWSAPSDAYYFVQTVPADPTHLVVSELHYRPADVTTNEMAAGYANRDVFEFLELLNTSETNLNLSAVNFFRSNDEGIAFDFASSPIRDLGPGERVLLVSNRDAFAQRYGTNMLSRLAGEYQGNLSNDGELLMLRSGTNEVIHAFTYNDQPPWPQAANGAGFSLVLIDPTRTPVPDHNNPLNWRGSLAPGGTPGSADALDYTSWKSVHAVPLAEPVLDIDLDGRVNLIEYLQDTDPHTPDAVKGFVAAIEPVDVLGVVDEYFTFRVLRKVDADDLEVTVELSDDLDLWLSDETVFLERDRMGVSPVEWLIFRSRTPAVYYSVKYARLRVGAR